MIIICVVLTACKSAYEKAERGYEYKIISGANGKQLLNGDILEFHLRQMYSNGKLDTVLLLTQHTFNSFQFRFNLIRAINSYSISYALSIAFSISFSTTFYSRLDRNSVRRYNLNTLLN